MDIGRPLLFDYQKSDIITRIVTQKRVIGKDVKKGKEYLSLKSRFQKITTQIHRIRSQT